MTTPIGDIDRRYRCWPEHRSHHRTPKSDERIERDLQDQMEDFLLELEAAERSYKYEDGWVLLRGIHRDYKMARDATAKPDDDIHRGPRKYQKNRRRT